MQSNWCFSIVLVFVIFYSAIAVNLGVNCTANERREVCATSEHESTAAVQLTNKIKWKPKWRPKKKLPPKKSNETPYSTFKECLDETADPCHDFYEFACGQFLAHYPARLPTDSFGITENLQKEVTRNQIELIMSREPTHSRAIEKMRVYMKKCLDTESIRRQGTSGLWASMQAIGQGFPMLADSFDSNKFNLENTLIKMIETTGEDFLFKMEVIPFGNKELKPMVTVADLIAPSPKFYFNVESGIKMNALRDYLIDIIDRIARAHRPETTFAEIKSQVDKVIDYEKGLAKKLVWGKVDRPAIEEKTKIDLKKMSDLKSAVTIINWDRFLQRHPLVAAELRPFLRDTLPIYLYTERVLREVNAYHKAADKRVLANYLFVQLLVNQIPFMDQPFIEAADLFAEQVDRSRRKSERKDKCYNEALRFFPLVSDHVYVKEHLKKESITNMNQMIEQLRHAMVSILGAEKWLDKKTRNYAVKKMKKMRKIIGISEDVKDQHRLDERYKEIHFAMSDSYHSMSVKLKKYVAQRELMRWQNPDVARLLSDYPPSTQLNAQYRYFDNSVYICAALLQAPILDPEQPAAVNYGVIGFIVGHEMMHGFDKQGKIGALPPSSGPHDSLVLRVSGMYFDEDGKYLNWWDSKSKKVLKKRVRRLVDQYDKQVESMTGEYVDGKLTRLENIADSTRELICQPTYPADSDGGIRAAFKAYKRDLKGKRERHVSGYKHYTNSQTFFIAYATWFCSSLSKEQHENLLKTDKHAPDRTRVNVVLSNFPEFAKAFKCKKGTKMNPVEQFSVW